MRRHIASSVVTMFIGAQLTGCAAIPGAAAGGASGAAAGGASGAATGGAAGAAIGGAAGAAVSESTVKGAVVGAAVGAIAGGFIGDYLDKQTASRAEAATKYSSRDHLELETSSLTPEEVSPGESVETSVQYSALSATEGDQIKLTETRTLIGPQDTIQLAEREVLRDQGSHTSTLRFTIPKDFPKGDYTLVTTISDGKHRQSARNPLRVV